jgi:peptide/nickel transport system ATP-binding protein
MIYAGRTNRAEQDRTIDELFDAVGLRPEQKSLFPHQFSGGQRQRIGIARALSTRPSLIICDEPVSALDVAVQAQILNLLKSLQRQFDLTYLFISHDLGVIQHMCDHIAVMYMGKFMEQADRDSFFAAPRHPYSRALLDAVPSIKTAARPPARLVNGAIPDLSELQTGCRFASRCPHATSICESEVPPLAPVTGTSSRHYLACHLADEIGSAPVASS